MPKHPTPQPGISDIAPYTPGKSKVEGISRIIKLSSNENPWGPSPKAVAAFKEAASNLHRYPDGAHVALREAVGKAYSLPAEQLICGCGSDELIGLLIGAYAGHGDEVLYSAHGFLMYKIYAQGHGATPVTAPETNLTANVDALLAAVTPNTKILFLANPNNPTGTVLPFSEVRRLRENLPEHIILGLDAAYAEYMTDASYEDGVSLAKEGTNTVVFHTLSKIYGLPGLRIGWAYGPAHIIDMMNRIRSPFNVNSPAILAAIAALEDQAYVETSRSNNAAERARVSKEIAAMGYDVVPSHTNFVLVKYGAQASAVTAYLAKHGIMVRDVVAYGLPEYVRISIGTAEENGELLAALKGFAAAQAA